MTPAELDNDPVVVAARARAAADVQVGISNLLDQYATAPEFKDGSKMDGSHIIDTPRATLRGHLLRLGINPEEAVQHVKARATDPDTSQTAARQALSRKEADQALVLAIHAAHPDGLTDQEMAAIAERPYTSLGVRRGELRDVGLIVDSGMKRPSPTGTPCKVWRITPAGLTAAREMAA